MPAKDKNPGRGRDKLSDDGTFMSPLRQLLRSPQRVVPTEARVGKAGEDEDDILMGPSLQEIIGSTDRMLATFSDFEDFELIDASDTDSEEEDEAESRRKLLRDVSKDGNCQLNDFLDMTQLPDVFISHHARAQSTIPLVFCNSLNR